MMRDTVSLEALGAEEVFLEAKNEGMASEAGECIVIGEISRCCQIRAIVWGEEYNGRLSQELKVIGQLDGRRKGRWGK